MKKDILAHDVLMQEISYLLQKRDNSHFELKSPIPLGYDEDLDWQITDVYFDGKKLLGHIPAFYAGDRPYSIELEVVDDSILKTIFLQLESERLCQEQLVADKRELEKVILTYESAGQSVKKLILAWIRKQLEDENDKSHTFFHDFDFGTDGYGIVTPRYIYIDEDSGETMLQQKDAVAEFFDAIPLSDFDPDALILIFREYEYSHKMKA